MDIDKIIQVAGVIDMEEARMLINSGVDWLGFPLRLTVHSEDLDEDTARSIIQILELHNCGTLITYLDNTDTIVALCRKLGVKKVQLHGRISVEEIKNLKSFAPDLFVIKSLIVRNNNKAELQQFVAEYSQFVDAFITDTYDPSTGAIGATGKTHDWTISKLLVQISSKPVILAGGLCPNNVRRAIYEVKPAGVDAHTRLENPDGRKNANLVRAFVREARTAFADLYK